MEKLKINEIIVVEGKDDVSAVKKAVDAEILMTNGYSLDKRARDLIKAASLRKKLIILTDSDYAGEVIRKRVEKLVGSENVAHAFLSREVSTKDGDIGVENASPESIAESLSKVRFTKKDKEDIFTQKDMLYNDLVGGNNSSNKRDFVGKLLGVGYCNAKQFLSRLNTFDITREEFNDALNKYENEVSNGWA